MFTPIFIPIFASRGPQGPRGLKLYLQIGDDGSNTSRSARTARIEMDNIESHMEKEESRSARTARIEILLTGKNTLVMKVAVRKDRED